MVVGREQHTQQTHMNKGWEVRQVRRRDEGGRDREVVDFRMR